MKLNGETISLTQAISLQDLLERHGYHDQRIAVEKNGEIIPKASYSDTMITGEDVLEVVSFVGGG